MCRPIFGNFTRPSRAKSGGKKKRWASCARSVEKTNMKSVFVVNIPHQYLEEIDVSEFEFCDTTESNTLSRQSGKKEPKRTDKGPSMDDSAVEGGCPQRQTFVEECGPNGCARDETDFRNIITPSRDVVQLFVEKNPEFANFVENSLKNRFQSPSVWKRVALLINEWWDIQRSEDD